MTKNAKKLVAIVMIVTLALICVGSVFDMPLSNVNADDKGEQLENNLVNYVVVSSPSLSLNDTQKVMIGIGNSELALKDSVLFYRNDSTGEEYCVPASRMTEDSFEYEINFVGHNEGEYSLTYLQYKIDEEEHVIELKNAGIDAKWGVGVVVETNNDDVIEEIDDGSASDGSDASDVVYTVRTQDNSTYNSKKLSTAIDKAVGDKKTKKTNPDGSYKGSGANGELIVCLDPGHGGSDAGACENGIIEKDHNLLIATICQNELAKYNNVCVVKTRDGDYDVGLEERVNIAAFCHADLFVSIHLNSAGQASGAEVYYPNGSYNAIASYAGYNVSNAILNNLGALGLVKRGVKIRNGSQTYPDGSVADYYSVIRNSKLRGIPGIIVEHCFLSNTFEAECLKDWNFVNALGVADANGIAQAYNLNDNWKPTGIYIPKHTYNDILCGAVIENNYINLDYRWLAYNCSTGQWILISDWKSNNSWMDWDPGRSGDYLIRCEVRETYNPSKQQDVNIGLHHRELISGVCQMPDFSGVGALIGMASQFNNPNYRYEICILDCAKLNTSTPWVMGTGLTKANGALWVRWNLPVGYYITLFRLYDSKGNIIDQECFPFVNV